MFQSNLGFDFVVKEVQVDDESVTIQIWDTAGQERYRGLGKAFYRGADCVVLVYDTTKKSTFDSLEYWRDDFFAIGMPNDRDSFPVSIYYSLQSKRKNFDMND